jgi:GDP-L-fucose synthase
MRILLTGGTGMVGRNLLEHPAISEFEILYPSRSELDIQDFGETVTYVRNLQPELVIHAAGRVGGIQANIREPLRFLAENLDMGRNIVRACHESGVKRFLNLGSSCMYPRNAPNPLQEDMVLKGELEPTNEGYALAKIVVARLCEYVSRQDASFQYKTLIPCNLFGRHDKFDPSLSHFVAAALHKVHQAKERGEECVEIWGDGTAQREFMYAADLADCLVAAIRRFDDLPSTMNVGVGTDLSVDEYYQIIKDVVGYTGKFQHNLSKPVGMRRKLLDVRKASAWGWRAGTPLTKGLEQTYDFYLQARKESRGKELPLGEPYLG